MNIDRIKPTQDNVLLQFVCAADPTTMRVSEGGIFIPQIADAPKQGQAIEATVIAAGPGHYADKWLGHEEGTAPVGSTKFIPLDAALVPDVRVLCNASVLAADRIYSDERHEYRMCRASCIDAVLENE